VIQASASDKQTLSGAAVAAGITVGPQAVTVLRMSPSGRTADPTLVRFLQRYLSPWLVEVLYKPAVRVLYRLCRPLDRADGMAAEASGPLLHHGLRQEFAASAVIGDV